MTRKEEINQAAENFLDKNKNLIILKSRNAGYQDIQKQLYEELKGKNKQ